MRSAGGRAKSPPRPCRLRSEQRDGPSADRAQRSCSSAWFVVPRFVLRVCMRLAVEMFRPDAQIDPFRKGGPQLLGEHRLPDARAGFGAEEFFAVGHHGLDEILQDQSLDSLVGFCLGIVRGTVQFGQFERRRVRRECSAGLRRGWRLDAVENLGKTIVPCLSCRRFRGLPRTSGPKSNRPSS
jgi:hypothetical protein